MPTLPPRLHRAWPPALAAALVLSVTAVATGSVTLGAVRQTALAGLDGPDGDYIFPFTMNGRGETAGNVHTRLPNAGNRFGDVPVRWTTSGRVTRLPFAPGDVIGSQIFDINDAGAVAGYSLVVLTRSEPDGSGVSHPLTTGHQATVWDASGTGRLLPTPAAAGSSPTSYANGIDATGAAYGYATGSSWRFLQPLRWRPGAPEADAMQTGCDAGPSECGAYMLRTGASGASIGSRVSRAWPYVDAVYWRDAAAAPVTIPMPSHEYVASSAFFQGINPGGTSAVGYASRRRSDGSDEYRALLYDAVAGETRDITPEGATQALAIAVNAQGDVLMRACVPDTGCATGLLIDGAFAPFARPEGVAEVYAYTIGELSNDVDGALHFLGILIRSGQPYVKSVLSTAVTRASAAPTVSFGAATVAGTEGAPLTFTAAASSPSGGALSFAWDFGDGRPTVTTAEPTVTYTYADNGIYTATVTVTDGAGSAQASVAAHVANVAPTATLRAPATVREGEAFSLALADPADAPGDVLSFALDCGAGYDAASATAARSCALPDNGTYTVRGRVSDDDGGHTEYTATVTATNVAPRVGAVAASAWGPVAAGSAAATVTVSAPFTDPAGAADAPFAGAVVWDGDAGAGEAADASSATSVTASKALAAGVYTPTLRVTDKTTDPARLTGSSTAAQYVVVYDPAAGFVTGGGWILSPAAACQHSAVCQGAVGRANFGFVSRYQKGAETPTGNTEFVFEAGELRFKSASYQWLVVSGARAQYKGAGAVNGRTGYSFLLTAIDGAAAGGGGTDAFRIKITEDATGAVIYDNKLGADDDSGASTLLDGATGQGSIIIHAK